MEALMLMHAKKKKLQMLHYKVRCTNITIPHIAIYRMHFNSNKEKLYKKKDPNIWEKALKNLRVSIFSTNFLWEISLH